jgi:purine-binding chemotaxis protein CheW
MAVATLPLLEFELAGGRYGLPLDAVIEVAPRVRVTALPGAPPAVVGVVRYRGQVVVAIELRTRFGEPARVPSLEDHFILARTSRRMVALVVDAVVALRDVEAASIAPPPVSLAHVRGIAHVGDGLILLHDLDAVLALDEEAAVDRALAAS